MDRFITENMPNNEVEQYCQDQRDLGATECNVTDNGNGTSNVEVVSPDD